MTYSRASHYEEYREFFDILRSGDVSQYRMARTLIPDLVTPPRRPSSAQLDTRPVQFKLKSTPAEENAEASSDEESVGPTTPNTLEYFGGGIDDAGVSFIEPSCSIRDGSSTESIGNDGLLGDMPYKETPVKPDPLPPALDAFDRLSISSAARTVEQAIEGDPDAQASPETTLDEIEEYMSTIPQSDESKEARRNFKKALRGLYSLESLRDVVRAFIRDSQETHVPLAEVEVRRAREAASSAF